MCSNVNQTGKLDIMLWLLSNLAFSLQYYRSKYVSLFPKQCFRAITRYIFAGYDELHIIELSFFQGDLVDSRSRWEILNKRLSLTHNYNHMISKLHQMRKVHQHNTRQLVNRSYKVKCSAWFMIQREKITSWQSTGQHIYSTCVKCIMHSKKKLQST